MLAIARPVVFPLHAIVDGKCACGVDSCARVGKHAKVMWRDVEYGSAVPRPADGEGVAIRTGAHPKGSEIFVFDLDGVEAAEAFGAMGPCPETFTVQSPRKGGGWHLYFKHPGFPVKTSSGALGQGIDIRGDGGIVVAPGSPHKSGGTYTVLEDVPIADAPEWLLEWLSKQKAPTSVQSYPGDVQGEQREYHRGLYTERLRTAPPSIAGAGGDDALWEVVQFGAHDLRLPGDDVLELIAEHFDPRCRPSWGGELESKVLHKVTSAKESSTRPRAEPMPADLAELFAARAAAVANDTARAVDAPASAKPKWPTPAERAARVGGHNLVRMETGFPSIDSATRGGILQRKVVFVGGAPGAGKTALLVQIAYRWLVLGVCVCFLAADEDADSILIRFGQLAGLSRDGLENGDPIERAKLVAWCESVPLILADGDDEYSTVEDASLALRDAAGGKPSAFFADSMQTVRTKEAPPRGADVRARINVVVRVLKHAAKVDGHIVFATSELSRSAYRNKDQAENANPLAAFKESGDIEYGAGLALVLVSRQGTSAFVDATVVKNRLGHGKPGFLLRLDHVRAGVEETAAGAATTDDPLHFVKCEIRSVIEKQFGSALQKNAVYSLVGGRKQLVLRAIGELADAKELIEDRRGGYRFPLPGDVGYVQRHG